MPKDRRPFLAVATWAEALPLLGFGPVITGMGKRPYRLGSHTEVLSAGFAGACGEQSPGDTVTGEVRTLDHIATPAEKAALGREGVAAVDMESRWLAEAAAAAGLPFTSVRVIIDRVDDPAVGLAAARHYPRAALTLRRAVRRALAHAQP